MSGLPGSLSYGLVLVIASLVVPVDNADRIEPIGATVIPVSPSLTAQHIAALSGGRPITIAEARTAGITRSQIRAAIAAGTITRVRHGVICVSGMNGGDRREQTLHRVRALLTRMDSDIVVSHSSAAILHGLPLPPGGDDGLVHLTSLRRRRLQVPGAFIHAARGDVTEHITSIEGVPVVTAMRAAIDVARGRSLPHALIPLDAAVRHCVINDPRTHAYRYDDERAECTQVTEEVIRSLRAQVAHLRYCTGIELLRRASLLVSPLSESPLESGSRGELIDAGMPPLALQFRFIDGRGDGRRADFLLVEGLIGEADGMIKYDGEDGRERLHAEKLRDLAAAEVAIRTLRWSARDVWSRTDAWLRHLRRERYAKR